MNNILLSVIIIFVVCGFTYLLGRIFVKAGLHEIENYFHRKTKSHIQTKKEENGTEEEK
jgi:hypothetical protein